MKNFLPKDYIHNKKLRINHSYLVEQFSDYSKIFKEIEKVVKKGDYTLGKKVDEYFMLNIKGKDIRFTITAIKKITIDEKAV